ncbi:MAG: thioredoxin family protein [Thermoplasmata archaeon]
MGRLTQKRRAGWESLGLEVLRTNDFEGTRLRRDGTYIVCFGATWCPATRRFAPKFTSRNGRIPARLAMADITSLDDPLWDSFPIKITPTMAVFQDGTMVGRFNGRRILGLRNSDLDRLTDLVRTLASAGSFTTNARPAE